MEKGKFKFWWENHDFSAAATTSWVLIRVADPDPGVLVGAGVQFKVVSGSGFQNMD